MGRWHRQCRADEGFSLLEVVVAMAVFTVTVGAVLGVMIRVLDVTRSNTHRVAAANLATKQIESTRSMRTLDIPDGAVVRSETVAGTTFTVTQTANYVVSGANSSVCQGTGDQLAYKLVTVEVSWPRMGAVRPVRADTLKALGLGTNGLSSARGVLAVLVKDAAGVAKAGVAVTLAPGGVTRVTGTDGCAVFVNLVVGQSYTASVAQSGFVGYLNRQSAQLSASVQAGRITRADLLYDQGRSLTVAWSARPGHVAPAGLPVRYRTSYVNDGAVLAACPSTDACATGLPGTAVNLFPAVYEVNAGSCADARSGTATSDLRVGDGAVTVPLAAFTVKVQIDSNATQGSQVTTTHTAESTAGGCASGESYTMTTDTSGDLRVALPRGTWTFSAPGMKTETATSNGGNGATQVKLDKQ